VDEESALPGQNQSVNDAQNRVDGVRVPGLPNVTVTGPCIPAGTEVAPLKKPLAILQFNLHLFVGVRCFRRLEQLDIKLELGIRGRLNESCVTILEQLAKSGVLRVQRNRHSADLDGNRVIDWSLIGIAHRFRRSESQSSRLNRLGENR